MTNLVVRSLLWFSAISSGLLARVYFAFSTFIMTALARIAQVHGVSAMNSINSTILRLPFMPLFFRHDGSKRGARDHRPAAQKRAQRDRAARRRADLYLGHVSVHRLPKCAAEQCAGRG